MPSWFDPAKREAFVPVLTMKAFPIGLTENRLRAFDAQLVLCVSPPL